MRVDIHSHTAPAGYVEAIRRDPKRTGCRCVFDPASLEFLIKTMGADHVLLGTDYPTPMIDAGQVAVIDKISGLSAADKENVMGGNAARLLGLQ